MLSLPEWQHVPVSGVPQGCLALFCISLLAVLTKPHTPTSPSTSQLPPDVCLWLWEEEWGVLGALHMFAITLLFLLRVPPGKTTSIMQRAKTHLPKCSHSQRTKIDIKCKGDHLLLSTRHCKEAGRILAHPRKSRTCR